MKIALFFLILIVFQSCSSDGSEREINQAVRSEDLYIEGNYYKINGELYTGKVMDTTENGILLKSFSCVNGKIEGEYLEFSTKTRILLKRNYENGLIISENKYRKPINVRYSSRNSRVNLRVDRTSNRIRKRRVGRTSNRIKERRVGRTSNRIRE
jgi:hypothetical protein